MAQWVQQIVTNKGIVTSVTAGNIPASDVTGAVPDTRNVNTTAPLTGGGALSSDLTLAVSTFSTGASGVVPASGGGTANFLRADGTWAAPPTSGGTVTSVDGSGGSTGLTLTGGPITTAGTLTLGGMLIVTNGGTGAASLTAHGILLGEGTSAVTATAVMTDGQLLVGQSGADPLPKTVSGDLAAAANGVFTLATVNSNVGTWNTLTVNAKGLVTAASNTAYLTANQTITLSGDTTGSGATAITTTTAKVNGVAYPASPATNTVPVVTGANTVTYEAVPNTALANSSVTVAAGTGLSGGGSVSLGGTVTVSLIAPVTVALGGTNSTTAVTNSNLVVTSGGKIVDSSVSTGGTWSANSNRLVNVSDPTGVQDAVTLGYLQLQLSEIDNKQECQTATVTALPANTYANGSAGIGATITLTVAAVLVLDGYTPVLNDRILVKNEGTPSHNGIYVLSTIGTVLVNAILTRSTDFDQPTDGINGAMVYVLNGATNGNTLWNCTTSGTITFGTTAINWSKFLGSTYSADGTTLTLTGTTFSITPVITAGGPAGSGSVVPVITYNAYGQLTVVSTATITPTAIGAVASVTASAPLASSGGTNPNVSIDSGYFAFAHKFGVD